MQKEVEPLVYIFNSNTLFFKILLDDVKDEDVTERISENSSNIGFVMCHLLDGRYGLAEKLGMERKLKYKELFDSKDKLEDFTEYPPVKELVSEWVALSIEMAKVLKGLSADDLQGEVDFQIEVNDKRLIHILSLLIHHETYHVGQLGLLRKYHGYPSPKMG